MTCALLQTAECPTLLQQPGEAIDENAIIIGALTPAGYTELGDNMAAALQMALERSARIACHADHPN